MKRWLAMLLCLTMLLPAACAEEAGTGLTDEALMTYYDQSFFIGDSLIRMLRNYVKDVQKKDPGFFPGIRFYSSYSFQLGTAAREKVNASGDSVNLVYKGNDISLKELLRKEQPAKVFILAGLNDKIHAHIDRADEYIDKIMNFTAEVAPDTRVYFFSLTPVTHRVEEQRHIRDLIDAYNVWLEEKCAQVGATYIDIASGVKGEDGLMPIAISQDREYHLNADGNAIWARELLDFARQQYESGAWTPETAGQ